jgi:hypothetical protein
VLSFETEFGKKYMTTNEDAINLMQLEMPRFLKSAGLDPKNITWYAGLHENTQHKHIHFAFMENAPSRYTQRGNELTYSKGLIYSGVLSRFKVSVEQRMTNITAELKVMRKTVTDIVGNTLFSKEFNQRQIEELQDSMLELTAQLPKEGRLSYNSENMAPLRPLVRKIVDCMIKSSPDVYEAFNKYTAALIRKDSQTKEMLIANKIDRKYWSKYLIEDKYLEDMYARLGNKVINAARVFKGKTKEVKGGSRLRWKWARKKTTAAVLSYCLRLNAEAEQYSLNAFREYMAQLKDEDENQKEEISMQNQKQNQEVM